jgi:hypothetical protein
MTPAPVRLALERVVPLLVAGSHDELERLDRGGRMRADESARVPRATSKNVWYGIFG